MKIIISILVVLLLASNAYWIYQYMDIAVTLSYRDQEAHGLEKTRKQIMAALPEIAKNATKEEIVNASSKYTDSEVYEKGGCTWVGMIGFKFDEKEKLQSVSPTWTYGGGDPCFQDF